MGITQERRQYIADLANDEWVDRVPRPIEDSEFDDLCKKMDKETDLFLENVQDIKELHLFAELWNWDGGVDRMLQVIQHPVCDAGTALMVYWLARPEYYLSLDPDDDAFTMFHETVSLVRAIEKRYLADNYETRKIRFDPKKEGLVGLYGPAENWKRELPEKMYEAV